MNKALLKPFEEIQFLEGMMYLKGFLEGANFTRTEELVNRFPEDFRLISSGKDEKKRDYVLLAYGNFRYTVIPNLYAEIKKNNIKYPKIVLAQAILETGWFKSAVCRNKNNLFGLTNPRTKTYYEFDHWTGSVTAYRTKVQYKYKGGNYLLWLRDIGYAEDKGYIQGVIRVLKQL